METPSPTSVGISPALQEKVKTFLARLLQNFSKKAGETVRFVCGHTITEAVLKEVPEATLSWTFNDEPLELDPSRVLYYKGNIDVTDLTPGDSGVYTCLARWGAENAKENLTLGIYSLQVLTDNPFRYVFEEEPMRLDCHSVTIGRLFPAATRQWLYNGSLLQAPPPTLAYSKTDDAIPRVTKAMAGVWECQVVHSSTDRTWYTAWLKIGVMDPPSTASKVYVALTAHRMLLLIVVSIIVVVLCVLFVWACFKMKAKEDEMDVEFVKQRNGWEETLEKYSANGQMNVEEIDKLAPREAKNANEGVGQTGDKSTDESGKATETLAETTETGGELNEIDNDRDNEAMIKVPESVRDRTEDEIADETSEELTGEREDVPGEETMEEEIDNDQIFAENIDKTKNLSSNQLALSTQKKHESLYQGKKSAMKISIHSRRQDVQINRVDDNASNKQLSFQSKIRTRQKKWNKRPHVLRKNPLSKGIAYDWLLQNSEHLRKLDAILESKKEIILPRFDYSENNSAELDSFTPDKYEDKHSACSWESIYIKNRMAQKSRKLGRIFKRETTAGRLSQHHCNMHPLDDFQLTGADSYGKNSLKKENVSLTRDLNRNNAKQATAKYSHSTTFQFSLQSWKTWAFAKIGLHPSWSENLMSWQHCDIKYSALPQVDSFEDTGV